MGLTFDCLHAYLEDAITELGVKRVTNLNLIPYCRRLAKNDAEATLTLNSESIITFGELYRKGITSAQLLAWFAPIDVAEEYEIHGEHSNETFANCSSSWFGSQCQYRSLTKESSFSASVQSRFRQRTVLWFQDEDEIDATCYAFLPNCYRGGIAICLDWREICDGTIDCLDGEDEQFCSKLEGDQCADDEYRCHYGAQCIPSAFVRDGRTSLDCLDGSDEVYFNSKFPFMEYLCTRHPTFPCEEYKTSRLGYFSCGDGEYVTHTIPHFTDTCSSYRGTWATLKTFISLDYITDTHCRQVFFCLFRPGQYNYVIQRANNTVCRTMTNRCTRPWFIWPEYPILYKFFQFVFFNNRSVSQLPINRTPDLICVRTSRCPALSFCAEDADIDQDLSCCRASRLLTETIHDWSSVLRTALEDVQLRCATIGNEEQCADSSLFHCRQSRRCIPKQRLVDGQRDCYYGEDETFSACELNDRWRFPCPSEPHKCLSLIAVENQELDCEDGEDEVSATERERRNEALPFAMFCDGTVDLPQAANDTDESDCHWWPCVNPYTRCDNRWHCLNGMDELNCSSTNCSFNEHKCAFSSADPYKCVSVSDMKERYGRWNSSADFFREVYAIGHDDGDLTNYFAWSATKCITAEHLLPSEFAPTVADDDVCFIQRKLPVTHGIPVAFMRSIYPIAPACLLVRLFTERMSMPFFRTTQLGNQPAVTSITTHPLALPVSRALATPFNVDSDNQWHCHRGMTFLHNDNRTKTCFCPPSYFGDRCQWQNERISLTLQFIYRPATYTPMVFQVAIVLVDEQQRTPSSYEQLTYVPTSDCGTKFNTYLLYPDRPKDPMGRYSVAVTVYDRMSMTYWISWHLLVPFAFLPVNRIAAQLIIPSVAQAGSCPLSCGRHGHCRRYMNRNASYFCQCDRDYSGAHCEKAHRCSCSADSLCHTSSMCICPVDKFGPRCYLAHAIDRSTNQSCQNGGLHIPADDRFSTKPFQCLCQERFYGERCEHVRNRIDLYLTNEIIGDAAVVYLHYIIASEANKHERLSTLKKIKYNENSLTTFVAQPFHILIAEFSPQAYYLAVVREKFIPSEHIHAPVTPAERCVSVDELFNATIKSYPHLHRIKHYPQLCRQHRTLKCLYDERYMCLCDQNRFSNCFTFNHITNYDCQGRNDCANDGQCFQDNPTCPSLTICVCPSCYYGPQCRLSTKGFVLSLDYILGYHIKPQVALMHQPLIVKLSFGLPIVIFLAGVANAIPSIAVLRAKRMREIGCGFYLLTSFHVSILIISALLVKSCQLIYSQIGLLTEQTSLSVSCRWLDMITQVLLVSNDWLHSSVAIERMLMVIKKAAFNRASSKRLAKWICMGIVLFASLTHLHYPFYRQLTDVIDVDERRVWCLIEYSPSISIFNSFVALFHFLVPFSINVTSMLVTIVWLARSHANVRPQHTFRAHIRLQFREHKHHLITSCTLVLLALPRLIISFLSGCMKSPRHSGVFLAAYLISYLPSMITLLIFILPSNMYKKELSNVFERTVRRVRRRTDH